MKKMFLLLSAFFFLNGIASAANGNIIFSTQMINPKPVGHPTPKSPVEVPTVYIEDYVLTFMVGHPEYVLNIKDEDGYVVYTNTVWSTDTEVILPSTLSGDYEIELVMGNWLFTGWINVYNDNH